MRIYNFEQMMKGILTAGSGGQKSGESPTTMLILMFLLIGISFWLIILRPQKKEQAERKQKLESMKKGQKVISIGGIHGTIISVDKDSDTILVEVAKNVQVRFLRSAISTVVKD